LLNKGQKVHYEWLEKGDFKNIEQDVVKKWFMCFSKLLFHPN
jgi:hypothetical protein